MKPDKGGKVIKAQRVSDYTQRKNKNSFSALETASLFCYLFPQYTLAEARKLPAVHINKMIKEARREQSRNYLELLQISAAPHTKKGEGVKSLTDRYKKEL